MGEVIVKPAYCDWGIRIRNLNYCATAGCKRIMYGRQKINLSLGWHMFQDVKNRN